MSSTPWTRWTVVTPGITVGLVRTVWSQSMSANASPGVHGSKPSGSVSPGVGSGRDGNGTRCRWASSR